MRLHTEAGTIDLEQTRRSRRCGSCEGLTASGAAIALVVTNEGKPPATIVLCATCLAAAVLVKLAAEHHRRGGSIDGMGIDTRTE